MTNKIFYILNDIPDGDVITLIENNTKERTTGEVNSVYQWAVNMINLFGNDCDFELV